MPTTGPGKHRHLANGKWTTDKDPDHVHSFVETAHPADALTADQVKALLLMAGGSGSTTAPAPAADVTAPIISGIMATQLSDSSVRIDWSLNEPGTGQVEYGLTSAYGSSSALDSTLGIAKSRTLTGLSVGTLHYRVKSADAAANLATSSDHSFTVAVLSPATVTVDTTTIAETAQFRLGAYAVQRFLQMGMTTTQRGVALDLLKDAVDVITYHWSGGYSNATANTTQQWKQSDFAPTSMGSARTWSGTTYRSLGQSFTDLDDLIARRPGAKMVLVMHDFPVAMNPGFTRSDRHNAPWPAATYWGASYAGQLCDEIIARYPGKILAFSYGQELKGITVRTSTTELDAFAAGYTAWATYMRANHPTIQLWYPHLNYFASSTNLADRGTRMDALIAGGSTLGANDDTIIDRLLAQVDPTLVDRLTYDISIVDSGADPSRGNYATVASRIAIEYHLMRVLKGKMTSAWGVVKPQVSIENYGDANQLDQDWQTEAQSAAIQTGMAMWAMKAGCTYHNRWEPNGGVPGQEAPDGDMASWYKSPSGSPYLAWPQIRDLRNTFAPGTDLYAVTSDDPNIVVVAGGTKVMLLNLSGSGAVSTVGSTGGTLPPVAVPAYSTVTLTLP